MRVCVLTHTYPRFTDDINAPFVETLMEHIAARECDVSVLTAYDPAWNRTPSDHTVDLRTYRYVWPDSLHILGYSRTIEGNVRFRKRMLALSPLLFAGAFRAFLSLVRKKKPEVLHAHWLLPNGFIAGMVSRLTGVPLIIQLHGSDVFTAEKNPLFRAMARSAAAAARYIVTPSPDLTRRLGVLGIDTRKALLVPNCVERDFAAQVTDGETGALRQRLGIPGGATVVLAMGRMVYVKGFDVLLDAFARIAASRSDVVLVLAGGGVLFTELERRVHDLGLDGRVIMPGAVMRDEVPVYFCMADLFIIPSIRHESGAVDGLPVVVPEAMAAGLPIVASAIGGIPVLVKDGWNGVLVPERSPEALADAVASLLDDHHARETYARRSREMVDRLVNYDAVADFMKNLYQYAVLDEPVSNITPFLDTSLEKIT